MSLRRGLPPELEQDGFDMTPMIDIVFQLIIFFMITTDLSKAQLESLTLPAASKAARDKPPDTTTLVVNIMKDGVVRVDGRIFWNPKRGDDYSKLEELFESRRQRKEYQELPGRAEYVKYPVLVRCDRSTAFEHLQRVMMIAARRGGVTRLQLGALEEPK